MARERAVTVVTVVRGLSSRLTHSKHAGKVNLDDYALMREREPACAGHLVGHVGRHGGKRAPARVVRDPAWAVA